MLASPPFPAPLPNIKPHSPPGVLPAPTLIGIEPSKRACQRIERVDFAVDEAEVANQQVTAKLAEPGWGKGETPRCGEFTAV